jgi:hypothetical protein
LQAGVHDASGRFGILRNARPGGRICAAHHHQDFAAKDFFVVLERRFALTIKAKIRNEIGCHFVDPFHLVLNNKFDVPMQMIDAFASDGGVAFRAR